MGSASKSESTYHLAITALESRRKKAESIVPLCRPQRQDIQAARHRTATGPRTKRLKSYKPRGVSCYESRMTRTRYGLKPAEPPTPAIILASHLDLARCSRIRRRLELHLQHDRKGPQDYPSHETPAKTCKRLERHLSWSTLDCSIHQDRTSTREPTTRTMNLAIRARMLTSVRAKTFPTKVTGRPNARRCYSPGSPRTSVLPHSSRRSGTSANAVASTSRILGTAPQSHRGFRSSAGAFVAPRRNSRLEHGLSVVSRRTQAASTRDRVNLPLHGCGVCLMPFVAASRSISRIRRGRF